MNLAKNVRDEASHLLDAAMVKIEHCVSQLTDEQLWWRSADDLASIGNLLVHITGNLKQWGITPFTGEPDKRNRGGEFELDLFIAREELMTSVRETVANAKSQFQKLDENQLLEQREIQGFTVTLMAAILHTSSHFVGHTHQIILLTRMQLGDNYQFEWSPESGRDFLPI